jgi:hypothetical protein
MQFDNVFVVEDVGSLGVLAVVDAGAPYSCEFQLLGQLPRWHNIKLAHNTLRDHYIASLAAKVKVSYIVQSVVWVLVWNHIFNSRNEPKGV